VPQCVFCISEPSPSAQRMSSEVGETFASSGVQIRHQDPTIKYDPAPSK